MTTVSPSNDLESGTVDQLNCDLQLWPVGPKIWTELFIPVPKCINPSTAFKMSCLNAWDAHTNARHWHKHKNTSHINVPACKTVRLVLILNQSSWLFQPFVKQTNKQSKDTEHVQKRCLKIIYPTLSYYEALGKSRLAV